MPRPLERLIEKAIAGNAKARPADAILILCDRPEDLQRRIDVLIEDGKLTEAERPRCVYWADADDWDGTHDGWVNMMAKNETDEERVRSFFGTSELAQKNLAVSLEALRQRKALARAAQDT